MAWRLRKRHTVLGANEAPCSRRSISVISVSVRFDFLLNRTKNDPAIGLDALRATITALALGSPPARLTPVCTHRTALAADTPNRSAAARCDIPLATAEISLQRRSPTRISPCLLPPCPADSANQFRSPMGIPSDSFRSDFALAPPTREEGCDGHTLHKGCGKKDMRCGARRGPF